MDTRGGTGLPELARVGCSAAGTRLDREGARKLKAERVCENVISVARSRLYPDTTGSRPNTIQAVPVTLLCPQLDSSASVLLGEEECTLGLGPKQCSTTAPAPPGSVILLVICRFFNEVRKNYFLSLNHRFRIWEVGP